MAAELRLVSTCPESCTMPPQEYLECVRTTARWCEEAGHDGLLIHSEHRLADPWVLAQEVLASVDHLRPVVTLRPPSLHPYAAAKKLATLAQLYGRAPDLVFAAGGSKEDLLALDDRAGHDDRYRRLVEYGRVVQELLGSSRPVDFEGHYYRLHKPAATTAIPADQQPRYFVAGSSPAGRAAAAELGAVAVTPFDPDGEHAAGAIRVGVITRPDATAAERDAQARFPEASARRLEHRLGMIWNDSDWQRRLEHLAATGGTPEPLWMSPFEHGYAQIPYLVGDYRGVARQLADAFARGVDWLFLDAPAGPADLGHLAEVVRRARNRATTTLALTG